MLIHLANGGGDFQNPEPFTKGMLINLAAGGDFFPNSELFTKGMLIHGVVESFLAEGIVNI